MGRSSIDEISTSGRTNESDSGGEGGLEQFLGFPGQLVSYPPGSDAFKEFCKAKKAIGGKWGKCVECTGVKSTVERKESLLDEVAEEETELELVLGELGLSRKKRLESRSKKIVKAQSTRSIMGVDKRKRQTSGEEVRAKTPGEKFIEGRSASMDDLKEVEERVKLAILQGKEDASQMVARLVKRIWLDIEEQESALKKAKNKLEKSLARAKTDTLKEVKQLKVVHAVVIGQLQVEAKANFNEIAEERDRLGRHLMLKGYSQEEVDAIKADTYAEEEEEEAKVLGVVDGLDGVSPQMVLDNQGNDFELPEGGSEKVVRDMSLRINDQESKLVRERKTSKALLSVQTELQRIRQKFTGKDDEMRLARENLSASEAAAKHLQTTLPTMDMEFREMQRREIVLEGEIRAKDLLVKRKDELLKDLPAREGLNAELWRLHTQIVDLEAMNLAEPAKFIAKSKANVIYHDRVDAKIIAWKDTCASLNVHLKRLKARFVKAVAPDVAQSDLLK
ncbi:hypothetical protein GIB67_030777, partial [Kingdonia uniflora]